MKIKSVSKLLFISLFFVFTSCTQGNDLLQKKISDSATGSNLSPQGGGTIDPKITSGETVINFKRGDSNLIVRLSLSKQAAVTTKATETTSATVTVSKLINEIYVNDIKYKVEIPGDKLFENKHSLNLIGLNKGDIIKLSTEVYDDKNNLAGKQSIDKKEITKDIESIDLNIAVNINIDVKTEVNVNQTVTGPTININLPAPQQPPSGAPPQPGFPTPSGIPSSSNQGNCLLPSQPESTVKLSDNTTIKICLPGTQAEGCYTPDPFGDVKLPDGRTIKICPPPNQPATKP